MWDAITHYLRYLIHSYELIPMLVELFLISFVVYTIIRFLGGTGGEKLFRGILFVVLGFWAIRMIADQVGLDLERIDWLFKYFLLVVLIIAMIAFQPEIRRGLMQLGQTRLGRSAAPEMENIIEQIVDTAASLSRGKTGALIAFEREVGLGDLVATGTRLNALVSADLLQTIFWPGSPLHDMGVIIRRGKLAAAGVQFPLAEHGEYDRILGSRHRAAIGLSKESDAVVVVISEETGQIGLAINGKLTRFLTLEQLRYRLLELLMPNASKTSANEVAASSEPKVSTDANAPSTETKKNKETKTSAKLSS